MILSAIRYTSLLLFAFISFTSISHALADDPQAAPQRSLRCALIVDPTAAELGGLMEADLLVRSDVDWVERSEIQKLFEEKKLQSLFGADSSGDRKATGAFLKADVLIIVRLIEGKIPLTELVVAETGAGVRLVSQRSPLNSTEKIEYAKGLVELADLGISRARRPIEHILAVPPFVNNDLTYEFDYLKSTYAKLVEQKLLEMPGSVVVEFDEAKAIANEANLTSSQGQVQRNLPIYIMGEYQNLKSGDKRKIQFRLKAQRGTKTIRDQEFTVKPGEASAALSQFVQQMTSSQGIEIAPVAPEQEVKLLNERGDIFFHLANLDEAEGLFEASLLLDNEQPEIHSRLVTIAQQRIQNEAYSNHGWTNLKEKAAIELNLAALQHVEFLLNRGEINLAKKHWLLLQLPGFLRTRIYRDRDPELTRFFRIGDQFAKQSEQLSYRLAYEVAKQKDFTLGSYLIHHVLLRQTPDVRYAHLKKFILTFQDIATHDQNVRQLLLEQFNRPTEFASVEGRQFLHDLIDSPETGQHVHVAAQKILDEIPTKPFDKPTILKNDPSRNSGQFTFREVKFEGVEKVSQIQSIGDKWDLIFNYETGYYLYSKEDGLRQIWDKARNQRIQFKYDGRWLWVGGATPELGLVLAAIDPVTGKRIDFTPQDGLPLVTTEEVPESLARMMALRFAPLEPGHVLAVGYMGRTWFADIHFDPESNHDVNVFHVAKDSLPADPKSVKPNDLNIAFQPFSVDTLQRRVNGQVVEQAVCVTRFSVIGQLSRNALLIDPKTLNFSIIKPSTREYITDHIYDGVFYTERQVPDKKDTLGLYRVELGKLQPKLVASGFQDGIYCFDLHSKKLYLVGDEWRQVNMQTGEITSLGKGPWYYSHHWSFMEPSPRPILEPGTLEIVSVFHTNNFGNVARVTSRNGQSRSALLQVLFDGSGASYEDVLGIKSKPATTPKSGPEFDLPTAEITGQENLNKIILLADLAYSPDGKHIATVSQRNGPHAVQVWNAIGGKLVANLLNDPVGMISVAYSPSGRLLATGSSDGRVILWDAQTFKVLRQWKSLSKPVIRLAFSPDSDSLAAACENRGASVWSVRTGEKLFDFQGFFLSTATCPGLVFTSDNRMLLSQDGSHSVEAYDAKSGDQLGKLEAFEWISGTFPRGSTVGMASNSDDLILRRPDGTIQVLWDDFPGVPIGISSDARFILAYHYQTVDKQKLFPFFSRLEIWDRTTKTRLYAEEGKQNLARSGLRCPTFAFSPDSKTLLLLDKKTGSLKQINLLDLAVHPQTDVIKQPGFGQ